MNKLESPDLWFLSCIELLESFHILYHTQTKYGVLRTSKFTPLVELLGPINLTEGLCLETLLKSCICEIDPSLVYAYTGGHDLYVLATFVNKNWSVSITDEEEDLLHELTDSVIWKGKYPANKPNKKTRSSNESVGISSQNYNLFRGLWLKYHTKLITHNSDINSFCRTYNRDQFESDNFFDSIQKRVITILQNN